MAREAFVYERHAGGFEAPRNSLEMQVEAHEIYCTRNIQDFYHMEEDPHQRKYLTLDALVDKSFNEEISRISDNRKKSSNIVARLMGMDVVPPDKRFPFPLVKMKVESRGIINKEQNASDLIGRISKNSSAQIGSDSLCYCQNGNADKQSCNHKTRKLGRTEHPQEEELQKFKKEFEAWQSARFRECAKGVELNTNDRYKSFQKDVVLHETNGKMTTQNAADMRRYTSETKLYQRSSLQNHLDRLKVSPHEHKEACSLRSKSLNKESEQSSKTFYSGKSASHTPSSKIVLLKPGPDRIWSSEDSQVKSSGTRERGSIEDFLQEVKERLKRELEGRSTKRGSVVRGSGIKTLWENPLNSKQLAQRIGKHVREHATNDLVMNLHCSEWTRASRNERQMDGLHSQKFVNRDTKKFWSERLRNVLKKDSHQDMCAIDSDSSGSSFRDSLWHSWKQERNDSSYRENIVHEQDVQARSFRYGPDNQEMLGKELSPKTLVRSLSAPLSRASFAKLLLEDGQITTGAHIKRKHENLLVETKTHKKERFNFREKVHNITHNFGLRGRLFSRKMQTAMQSESHNSNFARGIMREPTALLKFTERLENPTEVPPSPASMCGSAQEEFWRPSNTVSPISTPDMTMEEDELPKVFEEISLNLKELKRQLKLLESGEPVDITTELETIESNVVELDDQVQAYIRDLLIASGLYDGSLNMYLPLRDMLTMTISKAAFEQVEESYRKLATIGDKNEKLVCHKLLHDLLNEILPKILVPSLADSRFRRKITASYKVPPLSGKKLLSSAWEIIRMFVYPPVDEFYHSLENMVSRDLQSTRWSNFLDDQIDGLASEMERIIFADEIEDILKDI